MKHSHSSVILYYLVIKIGQIAGDDPLGTPLEPNHNQVQVNNVRIGIQDVIKKCSYFTLLVWIMSLLSIPISEQVLGRKSCKLLAINIARKKYFQ